jgi:DNA polymerase III subunit delta'
MQLLQATKKYENLWQRFQLTLSKQRLPHAFLLIGLELTAIREFSQAMIATILCDLDAKPCGNCKSCRLILAKEHPDVNIVEPEREGGVIKIDQIRDLNHLAYRSPQLSGRRVIIIYSAEKMNGAAANALLKLLEEPPQSVFFFLIAQQISSLPATIMSRCQQWHFMLNEQMNNDYLTLIQNPLFNELPQLIEGLTALIAHQVSISSLAEKWSAYEFSQLIGALYLLNCQLIDYKLRGCVNAQFWTEPLSRLARDFHPIHLFKQLDKLNDTNKRLQQNINLNQLLVLEDLLIGYQCKIPEEKSLSC